MDLIVNTFVELGTRFKCIQEYVAKTNIFLNLKCVTTCFKMMLKMHKDLKIYISEHANVSAAYVIFCLNLFSNIPSKDNISNNNQSGGSGGVSQGRPTIRTPLLYHTV